MQSESWLRTQQQLETRIKLEVPCHGLGWEKLEILFLTALERIWQQIVLLDPGLVKDRPKPSFSGGKSDQIDLYNVHIEDLMVYDTVLPMISSSDTNLWCRIVGRMNIAREYLAIRAEMQDQDTCSDPHQQEDLEYVNEKVSEVDGSSLKLRRRTYSYEVSQRRFKVQLA